MLFFLSALTGQGILQAQNKYAYTHYDDSNGMTQWHLTKVLQDDRGFIWFATWNGLNRFDGYNFDAFKSKPGDGNNLTSDRIRNMVVGVDGNIYCANNGDVWRFNLKTYKYERLDEKTQKLCKQQLDNDSAHFVGGRTITVDSYTFDEIRQRFIDQQKNIWLLGKVGVEKLTPITKPSLSHPNVPQLTVRAMFRDNQGRIWIGCRESCVVILDSKANLIGYLGKDGAIHGSQVEFYHAYCIFQQKNGTIWVGSKPDGLIRLTEKAGGSYSVKQFNVGTPAEIKAGKALNYNAVYDIKEDKKGRLWLATQGAGINLMLNPNSDVPQFLNVQNTFKSFPKDNVTMRKLYLCGDSLIMSTTTEGLVVINNYLGDPKNVTFTVHKRESDRKESLSCSALMDMVFSKSGRIFVSTESGGVNMLLTKNLRAKTFSFQQFSIDQGFGSDVALAMKEIDNDLIVQCCNQITRFRINNPDGASHPEDPVKSYTVENFNGQFFSLDTRFSDAAPLLLDDGRWLLSLEAGVAVIPEKVFHQRRFVPRIALCSVRIPGREPDYAVDNSDTIRLEAGERDFTLNYAALDFSGNNRQIRYVTRLIEEGGLFAGDSVQWSVPQDTRSVSFYNMEPGTYTLQIRSTNAEGLWVDNMRSVTIIVVPEFWETSFAYIIYILLAVLIISGITYTIVYIRNLKQQREANLQAYLKLMEREDVEKPISLEEEKPAVIAPMLNEEDESFMRRLTTFVDENLSNSEIGVEDMASATATSRSSLNRKMKTLVGVTPADFLKEARMKRAQQLLKQSSRSINDIAYACGFSDPKYFSKCFKTEVGVSPSDYRSNS